MAASGSFSIFRFNNYDISEKNIKYVYKKDVFNKFKREENIQKQSSEVFLKILKYSQEISMVEIVSKKKSVIAFLKLC